jgi:di/tricarboxylate transporter
MNTATPRIRTLLLQAVPFALAFGIWFAPIPAGLTKEAWHLFAIFAAAILAVILNAFPLLTASLLAVSAAVLTRTLDPAKAFAGFANASVLLVVVAFLVANAVVKSGLGRRISLHVVSVFGRSTLGLGYSIFLTDALIAPAFPSNTARGGVLYPIILSVAQNAGSMPDQQKNRRMGGYLMFCGMASLSVSSALWLTATSGNPIAVSLADHYGVKISFGSWLVAASIPMLMMIGLLPLVLYRLFPPGVTKTPDAPKAARDALRTMGRLSRDEWIVAAAFAFMVTGWAGHLYLARGAFCVERPVERARLYGLRGRAVDFPARWRHLAHRICNSAGALRIDALHVRQPVGADFGSFRRLPGCRREDRRSRALNDFRLALCQQLLLDDHSPGRKPKRHLCRERLSHSG